MFIDFLSLDPETWTHSQCVAWLNNVSFFTLSFPNWHLILYAPFFSTYPLLSNAHLTLSQRNLHPSPLATTAELLERINANMRVARDAEARR
jgi:hypothetical protein